MPSAQFSGMSLGLLEKHRVGKKSLQISYLVWLRRVINHVFDLPVTFPTRISQR
jgi:hypothetical protein